MVRDASKWVDPQINFDIEDGLAEIEWLVRRDTKTPRFVTMEVSVDEFESVDELKKEARHAYHRSGDVGVSPVKVMKKEVLGDET